MKERSAIETEYAKKLRKLVKDFSPKDMPIDSSSGTLKPSDNKPTRKASRAGTLQRNKNKGKDDSGKSGPSSLGGVRKPAKDDEYSHMEAYKQMLLEVGFIAGQHELLSESLHKENYKNVREQVKKLREVRRRNMDEHKKHLTELKQVYHAMEKAKEKFRKAFEDQERAVAAYNTANSDGSVTKNDIKKLNMQMQAKTSHCDTMKGQYANQMLKTNDARNRFYGQLLPNVLNELQRMEETRIALLTQSVREMIGKEREIAPIVAKCVDAMEESVNDIVPEGDTALVAEKYKTGDVPPGDFNFEDMKDPKALLDQDALEQTRPSNLNLYPRKRELEAQISAANEDLTKKRRELEGLQKMVQTCSVEPKYGKSDAFQKEVNEVALHVQELENVLKSLKTEHAEVESRLEGLKNRNSPHPGRFVGENGSVTESPMLNTMKRNIGDRQNALNQSVKSDRSSVNLSIASSSDNSGGGSNYYPNGVSTISSGNAPPPPPPMPNYNPAQYDIPEGVYTNRQGSHISDEGEYPLPPSQTISGGDSGGFASPTGSSNPPFSSTSSEASSTSAGGIMPSSVKRCEAMYDYQECDENNIPMMAGEKFFIVEDECDGWTRVKRLMPSSDGFDEGYVPASYVRIL